METKKAVIPVKGMTCVNCAPHPEGHLEACGVMNANVNYANEKAVVEFDPTRIGLGQFIRSINESGYQAVTERVTVPVIDLDVPVCRNLKGRICDRRRPQSVGERDGWDRGNGIRARQIGLRDIRRAIEREGFRLPNRPRPLRPGHRRKQHGSGSYPNSAPSL